MTAFDRAARSALYGREPIMTAKMTRSEFVRIAENAGPLNNGGAEWMAGLAESAGVEWLPERVEPRVGDLLTEATRLVDGLGVEKLARIAQWNREEDCWYYTGDEFRFPESNCYGHRIVFVPGEPEPEQKHETTVRRSAYRGGWFWICSCGRDKWITYGTQCEAEEAADHHAKAAQS